jgi:hypothetical protein
MTTLRIENTVRDYDDWKAAFDKFDRARRDRGVRSYRLSRSHGDPRQVAIDLEFDDPVRAEEFGEFLQEVWRTPQSQGVLADHRPPRVLEVLEDVHLG